ncbi:hypothetical protein [Dactylosporangium matsuzakiense]|uniref:Uncharacterized protein n=1 Tax=Dactylosporangium matsuzakiense TaxID=53360 RepID=A0A9W6NJE3_9ACTN|nr:hypothetical protein [Dactylosporangium matsuzakiense]UWZ42202.1 hypothetical protein Dmats_32080 [Dactylosporangium matsuzakiense]GLK99844.1 hypothetical protein GCM10017581_015850 [Dactylosporangium matsuzakiense]
MYPQSPMYPPPVTGGPGYPPPPFLPAPPPPPPPRSRAFVLLLVAVLLLAAATAVTAPLGWSGVAHRRQTVTDRRAELDRIDRQAQAAAAKQETDFRDADLATLLQRVKTLDTATDTAYSRWRTGVARYGELDGAMNDCDDAVIAYDRAAAPFPDRLFTALPRRINLDNPETDCGRAFTPNI